MILLSMILLAFLPHSNCRRPQMAHDCTVEDLIVGLSLFLGRRRMIFLLPNKPDQTKFELWTK